MKIAIVGLGLIGGSYAKSIAKYTDHEVYALSHNKTSINNAISDKAIVGGVDIDGLSNMDMTIICLPPTNTIAFLKDNVEKFKEGSIVCDVCGIKCAVQNEVAQLYTKNSVNYISIHPMAGRECSGYINALDNLFKDRSIILIENESASRESYDTIIALHRAIGFSRIVRTTKEKHDRIIAYTSQLCHVASNAFIKSPTSRMHLGFSGGSFEDLTRVAFLDADIWTDLFRLNREPLLSELNYFIESLNKYKDALENEDYTTLHELLEEGRNIKEAINNDK